MRKLHRLQLIYGVMMLLLAALIGLALTGNSNSALASYSTDTQVLESQCSSGEQGHGNSYGSVMSTDGRYIAFNSYAGNLVPGDTNGKRDVFVRDQLNGTTEGISVDISSGVYPFE